MKTLAPIVLFVYKRLDTLIETINALKRNKLAMESELFIFSDAAKTENDKEAIIEVRNYIKSISGFKTVTVYEAAVNKGLANSIIGGVTSIVEKYGKIIVLEDDLITSINFLDFMNQALDFYESTEQVMSVCGFSFPYKKASNEDVYFLNRFWPWGWATWSHQWRSIDWEVSDFESFKLDKIAQKQFSFLGSDVNEMLSKQMNGQLDSWAIRWTYHIFKNKGLVLFPEKSKISNEGFDEFATHTVGLKDRYITTIDNTLQHDFKFTREIKINDYKQKEFLKKFGLQARLLNKLKELFFKNF